MSKEKFSDILVRGPTVSWSSHWVHDSCSSWEVIHHLHRTRWLTAMLTRSVTGPFM